MKRKLGIGGSLLLIIVVVAASLPQTATAQTWEHYVFTDRDQFGFQNLQTRQIIWYGTREYGQIALKWLPPSYRGARGRLSYQNGLYYFCVPGQPGSDLFWHPGIGMWKR
jgi:hypothetical protein